MAPKGNVALYDKIIASVFEQVRKRAKKADSLDFDKGLLEDTILRMTASGEISRGIKNIADIKYTYDARKDFPEAIARLGYFAIVGRGKGKYSFVRLPHNNLIRIPTDLGARVDCVRFRDKTHHLVTSISGTDEQATMAAVRYNDIIGAFTGLSVVHHVQGHERTTVLAGQIEIDEVYVGADTNGIKFVIPISAKGGKDHVSYTQALNLIMYATEKRRYEGFAPLPLAVGKGLDGHIYVVQFSVQKDIRLIRILKACRFEAQP